jgi:TonB family protein
MKIFTITFALIMLQFAGISQSETPDSVLHSMDPDSIIFDGPYGHIEGQEQQVFMVVESMPEFPGGEKELFHYIMSNLNYPVAAYLNKVEGRGIINFTVEMDGKVSSARSYRPMGYGCDQEAIRVIESMPDWKPGYQRGKPVRVGFNIPVTFAIDPDVKSNMDKAEKLYAKAMDEYGKYNYPRTLELLEESLALHPYHIDALHLKGLALYKSGEYGKACEEWNFANDLWQEMMKGYLESSCGTVSEGEK